MATEERAEYHPEWKPDCIGKWDYDAPLVSLSSRYYPRGGGFFSIIDGKFETDKDRPEIRPSALASICIGDLANGPYETLAECDFEGDSEAEVKAAVEKWAAEMIARVDAAIRSEFGKPAPAGGTSELIHEIEVNHKCKCGHWNGDHSESDDGGRRVCMHLGCDCIIDTAPAGGEATK